MMFSIDIYYIIVGTEWQNIVKPACVATFIKQSPVLKGHLFLSCHRKFHTI